MTLLFIALISVCFAQGTETYTSIFNRETLKHCLTFSFVPKNGGTSPYYQCDQCIPGYKKSGSGASNTCVPDTSKPLQYPAYTSGNELSYHEIGSDTASETCTSNVKVVNYQNQEVTNDPYSDKDCYSCAELDSTKKNCITCAAGYVLRKGNCLPQSLGLFDVSTATNTECFLGKYDTTHDKPLCYLCNGETAFDNYKCKTFESPTMEGCIRYYKTDENKFICEECRPGYALSTDPSQGITYCTKRGGDFCLQPNVNEQKCDKCIPSYLPDEGSGACSKCSPVTPLDENVHDFDYCNLFDLASCSNCDKNCKVDGSKCVSTHCDFVNNAGGCLRCEEGYSIELIKCIKDDLNGFTSSDKLSCGKGYYMAKDSKNNYVCLPCKGNCMECVDKDICTNSVDFSGSGKITLLKPCLDPNCNKCSSIDASLCFECNANTVLKGGKCYTKGKVQLLADGSEVGICEYYQLQKESASITTVESLDKMYFKRKEVLYKKVQSGSEYLCENHEEVPYYYSYDSSSKEFSCRGDNRDPNKDCDCIDGYYPSSANKVSDCKEFKAFERCKKPLNDQICAQCEKGFVLNYVQNDNYKGYKFECGCPKGERIKTENGKTTCVPCSDLCETCRTKSDGTEQCLSCNGKARTDILIMKENNYFRDVKNGCECQSDYYAAPEGNDGSIYACYKPPEVCSEKGKFEVSEYSISCTKCNGENQDPQHFSGPCSGCLNGYYKIDNKNEPNGFKCEKCPIRQFDNKNVEYCHGCEIPQGSSTVGCTSCVDETLNSTANCETCIGGDRYILIHQYNEDESEVHPYCVKCPDYCIQPDSDADPLCFYGSEANSYDEYKSKYKNGHTYPFDMSGYKLYCSKCGENRVPKDDCECGTGTFKDYEKCTLCSEKFDESTKEVCNFDGIDKCGYDSHGKMKCVECKTDYNKRLVESNCHECEHGYVAVEDPSVGGCQACPDKCNGCHINDKGETVCTHCKQPSQYGDNCDQCYAGLFNKNGNCEVCSEECKECSGEAYKCTVCKDENSILWDKSQPIPLVYNPDKYVEGEFYGCVICKEGSYYDLNTEKCVSPSKEKLFASSVGVCVKKHESIEGLPYRGKDERGNLEKIDCSEEGAIGYEWATSCITTYDPESTDRLELSKRNILSVPSYGECVCKEGFIDVRTKSEILGNNEKVAQVQIPLCVDVRSATHDDLCVEAKFTGYVDTPIYKTEYVETIKTINEEYNSINFTTIDLIIEVTTLDGEVLMDKETLSQSTLGEVEKICNWNCIIKYSEPKEVLSHNDEVPQFECIKCNNEDYLTIKDGKCVCDTDKGYYQTRWGMCIPCNRHISGCKKCELDENKKIDPSVPGHIRQQLKCTSCEKGTLKDNKCI